MKKVILTFTLITLLAFSLFASTEYTVSTKYGDKRVVVPDGYTTEDVLLSVAKAYYEMDYEFKEVNTKLEELLIQVDEYIKDNKELREQYNALNTDYASLVKTLESLDRLDIVRVYSLAEVNIRDKVDSLGLSLGMIIHKKVILGVGMGFNPSYFTEGNILPFTKIEMGILF